MQNGNYHLPLENRYPETLDLGDSRLGDLSSQAAVEIDNHVLGRGNSTRHIRRLGKVIYMAFDDEKSLDFLNAFYSRQIFSRAINTSLDTEFENYQKIGLELIKLKGLPEERQKKLRALCVSLSQEFSSHWWSQHPNGFKQYVA